MTSMKAGQKVRWKGRQCVSVGDYAGQYGRIRFETQSLSFPVRLDDVLDLTVWGFNQRMRWLEKVEKRQREWEAGIVLACECPWRIAADMGVTKATAYRRMKACGWAYNARAGKWEKRLNHG